jgi:hypothetical protein
MTLNELTTYMTNLRSGLDEDLRNLADEMESLDPASKDFAEIDFEFNYITGQVTMLSHILQKVGQ